MSGEIDQGPLRVLSHAIGHAADGTWGRQPVGEMLTSPRLATWHRKVEEQVVDTIVLVVGDSTGVESSPARWVQRLCDKIAAQWPTHSVYRHPWDDATKTYPGGSVVTVQTGSGSRNIRVYNCSVSGQVIAYVRDNAPTVISGITPDLIIYSYGHNSPQDLTNYRAITHQGVMALAARMPDAALVMTLQNPRATITTGVTLSSDYAPDQVRQRANFEYAMAEGLPVANVNDAFRAYGDYNADLLTDGLHPNAAGSQLWADVAWGAIGPKGGIVAPPQSEGRLSRVWVPATQFLALTGSPALAIQHGMPCWAFDASAAEEISCIADWPSDWRCVNVDVFCSTATAPTADDRTALLALAFQYASSAPATGGSQTIGTWTGSGSGNVAVNMSTTANRTTLSTVWDRGTPSQRPLALRLTRVATDAADDLPQDLLVFGLMVQRMY
ncbi:MAG TPA: SGNH/GDSL hydrolase family protein [Xanthobacteraceae bacterium]|nr:SGNH/GDSL hydrolase family protein [Xanthobacteraceae bacterium]